LEGMLNVFVLDILIFYFDHILFVLVNNGQQLAFHLYKVLTHLMFIEVARLLLDNQIWIVLELPERMSISSIFFFFIVEFQWFLMELSVLPGSILVISAHLLP
jgi:hypothetical protein